MSDGLYFYQEALEDSASKFIQIVRIQFFEAIGLRPKFP